LFSLKVGGYIFLILLIGNVVSAVAIPFIPEKEIRVTVGEENPDFSELIEQTKEFEKSRGYILYEVIIALSKVVAMIFTVLAVKILYGVSRGKAILTCAIPYALYIVLPILSILITLSL